MFSYLKFHLSGMKILYECIWTSYYSLERGLAISHMKKIFEICVVGGRIFEVFYFYHVKMLINEKTFGKNCKPS